MGQSKEFYLRTRQIFLEFFSELNFCVVGFLGKFSRKKRNIENLLGTEPSKSNFSPEFTRKKQMKHLFDRNARKLVRTRRIIEKHDPI